MFNTIAGCCFICFKSLHSSSDVAAEETAAAIAAGTFRSCFYLPIDDPGFTAGAAITAKPSYGCWYFDTIEVEIHWLMHHCHHFVQMKVNVRAITEKIDCFSPRMMMMISY